MNLKNLINETLDLVYPNYLSCCICEGLMKNDRRYWICDECIEKINWQINTPFDDDKEHFAFSKVLACCAYGSEVRDAVLRMKSANQTYIARGLGNAMADKLKLWMNETGEAFDYLVPVPLSPEKQKQRGFNQSYLLATTIRDETGIEILNALARQSQSQELKKLSGIQRKGQDKGQYKLIDDLSNLNGKNIVLVDDVITTGNTANECAELLVKAGALSVTVLCFASSTRRY